MSNRQTERNDWFKMQEVAFTRWMNHVLSAEYSHRAVSISLSDMCSTSSFKRINTIRAHNLVRQKAMKLYWLPEMTKTVHNIGKVCTYHWI